MNSTNKPTGTTAGFVHNDGGLSAAGLREENDCTVRAFATASGKPYADVHAAFKKCGRRQGKGCNMRKLAQEVARLLGVKMRCTVRSGTLDAFLRANGSGRFIVRVHRHAFAVVDGVVFDTWQQKGRRIVKQAWRIDDGTARPPTKSRTA